MSEFLTVRLSSEQQSTIPWVVWSTDQQEVIASGEIAGWEHLDELVSYAGQRQVVALLASNDVVLTQVDIPPGATRQFEAMLPYLVEDEVAQDVDGLHFSVLGKQADKAQFCAVERAWIQTVLQRFSSQGIAIKRILPDVLALPVRGDHSCAAMIGEQWLIRHSATEGAVVDASWLDLYLSSYLQNHEGWKLDCYSSVPESALPEIWEPQPEEMTMALLAKGVTESKVNLLTGIFKPKSSWGKYWKLWQKATIAAGVLIVVMVAQQLLVVHKYEAQAQAYREESERIFRQVFPNKRRIPTVSYLKRQMDDEERRLSGGSGQQAMLSWLAALPATLGQVSDLEITSFKYDGQRGEVRIQARSSDFQPFEQARVKLAEKFNVEQGQLNRSDNVVVGSFVLKRL
ncbi:type II secretion system protein GspL [Vibrio alginolyticus]|uniref:type II secretion system protein GspL n=1 Tax=Vibrio alginolyticus TaxID=663 RepID=UPI000307C278|nr:type II secretion system protein GspL [Vibrio alginolyticus]EGQ7841263.1 type II secretion system protein GspL [Vibrio alginolyticus]EHK5084864.1 type II secretion system protein GspL [Vibrio alginolyticus]ELB1500185.1 type II secretion system protein GspL [Vibrio alginolyticus]ELB2734352.1 type II secretion system protein GspL [Vibrio alginolyticus]ELB2808204.1 type II secretion system protein GspL [Vibrio alginolyticus]